MQEVRSLGEELLREPVKRVNHVTKLLDTLGSEPRQAPGKSALKYLKRFFMASFEHGNLREPTEPSAGAADLQAPQEKLRVWLRQKFETLCGHLLGMLHEQGEEAVQVTALNTILELVRSQQVGVFDHSLFTRACTVLLQQPAVSQDVLELLISKYLQYADVRFYTLQTMHKVAECAQSQKVPSASILTGEQAGRRIFQLLSAIAPTLAPEGEESVQSWCGAVEAGVVRAAPVRGVGSQQRRKRKREAPSGEAGPVLGSVQWANPAAYKRAFSDAWLGLLRLPLPSDLLKKVLVQLHSKVMPSLPNPLLLSDFLSSCLDQGGLVGMLALNGLFTLVTKHGLEYPHFYARLYALLQAPVFRAKYRARFLQLADVFLSSGMVPAYTAAAFIKKFARLALTAPPAGAVIAIAFIHNLLRRHPSCSVLVNKPATPQSAAPASVPAPMPTATPAGTNKSTDTTGQQQTLPSALTNGKSHESEHASSSASEAESSDAGDSATQSGDDRGGQTAAGTVVGGSVEAGEDVFDENEVDPAKCRAIESSLWELESLRHHYYHAVATHVSILEKDLGDRKRTAEVDVGALLRSSYSEYFAMETQKRLKSVPVAFFPTAPTHLFPTAAQVEFPGWVC